jgi:hypothetical protein
MACVRGLAKIDKKTLDTLTYICPRCHGRRNIFFVGLFHLFAAYTADLITSQGLYDGDTPASNATNAALTCRGRCHLRVPGSTTRR